MPAAAARRNRTFLREKGNSPLSHFDQCESPLPKTGLPGAAYPGGNNEAETAH